MRLSLLAILFGLVVSVGCAPSVETDVTVATESVKGKATQADDEFPAAVLITTLVYLERKDDRGSSKLLSFEKKGLGFWIAPRVILTSERTIIPTADKRAEGYTNGPWLLASPGDSPNSEPSESPPIDLKRVDEFMSPNRLVISNPSAPGSLVTEEAEVLTDNDLADCSGSNVYGIGLLYVGEFDSFSFDRKKYPKARFPKIKAPDSSIFWSTPVRVVGRTIDEKSTDHIWWVKDSVAADKTFLYSAQQKDSEGGMVFTFPPQRETSRTLGCCQRQIFDSNDRVAS